MIDQLEAAAARPISRETLEKIEAYVALLHDESSRQNLVSRATLDDVWNRHILDSAQLVRFAPTNASWIDLGSGAGLPGIVLACLLDGPVTLVEPRRLRAAFLHRVSESLELNARVLCAKAERVTGRYEVITARALAPLRNLLEISQHLSTGKTTWILPKGRSAASELAEAQRTWQGAFHVERSVTDDDSSIIVGTGVRAKAS
ncbi:16S rRNA (guanine527-N7)-methyltransferase [Sphingomonas sp. F9_3S_D5_B_2]